MSDYTVLIIVGVVAFIVGATIAYFVTRKYFPRVRTDFMMPDVQYKMPEPMGQDALSDAFNAWYNSMNPSEMGGMFGAYKAGYHLAFKE